VARQALVRIEAGSKPIVVASGYNLDIGEPGEAISKERAFVRRKAGKGAAATRYAAADAGIPRHFHGLSRRLTGRHYQNRRGEYSEKS
jgi:hypothetical protein